MSINLKIRDLCQIVDALLRGKNTYLVTWPKNIAITYLRMYMNIHCMKMYLSYKFHVNWHINKRVMGILILMSIFTPCDYINPLYSKIAYNSKTKNLKYAIKNVSLGLI